jgi:hypothetical protein
VNVILSILPRNSHKTSSIITVVIITTRVKKKKKMPRVNKTKPRPHVRQPREPAGLFRTARRTPAVQDSQPRPDDLVPRDNQVPNDDSEEPSSSWDDAEDSGWESEENPTEKANYERLLSLKWTDNAEKKKRGPYGTFGLCAHFVYLLLF